MTDAFPPKDRKCHHTGFEKSCRALVAGGECSRWSALQGMNPQTGEAMNQWGCVEDHIPTLLMSIAKLTLEAGAATESFRNEVVGIRERVAQARGAIAAPQPIKAIEAAE